MTRFAVILVSALIFSSMGAVPRFSVPVQGSEAKQSVLPKVDTCHTSGSAAQIVLNMSKQQEQQDPPQPQLPPLQPDGSRDTPTHRYSPGDGCSIVDPRSQPGTQLNGVNPRTIGCKCVKTCSNGTTVEDTRKDTAGKYICNNACHRDRCSCPDPCKS